MNINIYSKILNNVGYEQDLIYVEYDKYINLSKENINGNLIGIYNNGISYRVGWNYKNKNNNIVGYLTDYSVKKEKIQKKLLNELKKKYKKIIKKKILNELIKIGLISDLSKIIINYI